MKLTLQEFINKYLGQSNVGNTPENRGQCVGLVSVWMDNFSIPHDWGNAKDLLVNANPDFFDIIKNDPNDLSQFPVPGDTVVFDGNLGGGFGHTGICVTADGNVINLFQQNDPIGSTPHQKSYGYSHVLGWLHIKASQMSPNTSEGTFVDKMTFETLVSKATKYDAFTAAGYLSANDVIQIISDLKLAKENTWKLYQGENARVVDLISQLQALNQEKSDLEGRFTELEKTNTDLKKNISEVQASNASLATHIAEMEKKDSTAIDSGIKSEADLKNTLSDLNTIAESLNTTYPDVRKVLIAVDTLRQQIDNGNTQQQNQAKSFQKYLQIFIDFFIKHKVK